MNQLILLLVVEWFCLLLSEVIWLWAKNGFSAFPLSGGFKRFALQPTPQNKVFEEVFAADPDKVNVRCVHTLRGDVAGLHVPWSQWGQRAQGAPGTLRNTQVKLLEKTA